MLTDEEIDRLSPAQRRELIGRLARPLREVAPSAPPLPNRKVRLTVVTASAVLLVPWIAYLAVTLPRSHRVRDWDALWVGYDVVLLALLALTAWFAWRRRALVLVTSFATGVLLVADAWFDMMTSVGAELWQSAGAAVLVELPLAALLMSGAFRAIRLASALLWLAEPSTPMWRIPLPAGRARP